MNDFDLKRNDFKVESHCSLRRINETCSSTHKRLPPSLPVVVEVDTDTPHLRQQWTTTALYNRVWKPWYLFCIIEKILAKFGILCTNAYLYEGDGVAIFSFCRDAWDQLLRSEIYAFCRCGWVEAKNLVPSQNNSRLRVGLYEAMDFTARRGKFLHLTFSTINEWKFDAH